MNWTVSVVVICIGLLHGVVPEEDFESPWHLSNREDADGNGDFEGGHSKQQHPVFYPSRGFPQHSGSAYRRDDSHLSEPVNQQHTGGGTTRGQNIFPLPANQRGTDDPEADESRGSDKSNNNKDRSDEKDRSEGYRTNGALTFIHDADNSEHINDKTDSRSGQRSGNSKTSPAEEKGGEIETKSHQDGGDRASGDGHETTRVQDETESVHKSAEDTAEDGEDGKTDFDDDAGDKETNPHRNNGETDDERTGMSGHRSADDKTIVPPISGTDGGDSNDDGNSRRTDVGNERTVSSETAGNGPDEDHDKNSGVKHDDEDSNTDEGGSAGGISRSTDKTDDGIARDADNHGDSEDHGDTDGGVSEGGPGHTGTGTGDVGDNRSEEDLDGYGDGHKQSDDGSPIHDMTGDTGAQDQDSKDENDEDDGYSGGNRGKLLHDDGGYNEEGGGQGGLGGTSAKGEDDGPGDEDTDTEQDSGGEGGTSNKENISGRDTDKHEYPKSKENLNDNPINKDEETQLSRDKDGSYDEYIPNGDEKDESEEGEHSERGPGDISDENQEENQSDEDNGDNEGSKEIGGRSCSRDDVARCFGKLADVNSMTLPTNQYPTLDELCSDALRMRRCFSTIRGACTSDVLYRFDVLRRTTNYICEVKRGDFVDVYNCLTESTDRYWRCYETQTTTDAETGVIRTTCRPVKDFENCVAEVTAAKCGQKAGELMRNLYEQSNPLVNAEQDGPCPFLESLKQADLEQPSQTALAVGLTMAGCVALAVGVIVSAIIGARRRTQMAHYILDEA